MSGPWRAQLPELFERVVAASPQERLRIFAELRALDEDVAAEVERLVAASEREGTVLDRPAWAELEDEIADAAPASIGPYRIVAEIGRGGMGRVYLAEQQGDGFARKVAVKLLERADASEDGVRRFHRERQILASLEHPGIARFYDGGRSPDGRWFLALEYVEGDDLVTHARKQGLSIDARVRLLLGVLEAVQYAHARLVVHRDLKPANVLVDREGRPRLLDFGISKLLGAEASEPDATRTEHRAMTPAYASPEQIRGERVAAASDVWSLGVVLYELLTGRRPFAPETTSGRAIEQAVLFDDPASPSTAARAGGAALRVPPDLDAIVGKALRKSVADRYLSADALADDLQRYLSRLPVRARLGGRRYRLGKFVARHRLALTAASAATLAFATGLALALWQRAEAVSERQIAERRFAEVHALSQWMSREIDDGLSVVPETAALRERVLERALEYLERLHADADDDPVLLADLAEGYARVGALLAEGPSAQITPRLERSHAAFERAVAIRRRLFASEPYRIERVVDLAQTLRRRARAGLGTPYHDAASAAIEEALVLARSVVVRAPEPPELAYLLASVLVTRLRLVRVTRELVGDQQDLALDDAAAAWSALLQIEPVPTLEDHQFGMDAAILSRILHERGREDEAVAAAERAIAVFDRSGVPAVHTGAAYAYATLAFRRKNEGRIDEALALHARAMTIRRARLEERDLPVSAYIAFFDSLLDDVELALARPDHERAQRGLDEADAFLDRMGWGGPDGAMARERVRELRARLGLGD